MQWTEIDPTRPYRGSEAKLQYGGKVSVVLGPPVYRIKTLDDGTSVQVPHSKGGRVIDKRSKPTFNRKDGVLESVWQLRIYDAGVETRKVYYFDNEEAAIDWFDEHEPEIEKGATPE